MTSPSSSHPLEHEDITVHVCLQHNPTKVKGFGRVKAPADASPSVSEAIEQATSQASDDLLARLEQQGG